MFLSQDLLRAVVGAPGCGAPGGELRAAAGRRLLHGRHRRPRRHHDPGAPHADVHRGEILTF